MLTFKQYLLEYQLKRNILNNVTKMKAGENGKDRNRAHMRKHSNTDVKKYHYSDSSVDRIMNGSIKAITLSKEKLAQVLAEYGVEFKPGTVKGLGNSGVEVEMFANRTGRLIRKDNGRV